jgi:phytoene dehydrogenase-like protein
MVDVLSENSFDVVVVGGGPSGFAAAVAAARMGRRVALVERHPILGGMGTVALVNNFCAAHFDGERFIIGGIFGEVRERLIERKAIYVRNPPTTTLKGEMEPYNPDVYAELLGAMCREAGVTLFLRRSWPSAKRQALPRRSRRNAFARFVKWIIAMCRRACTKTAESSTDSRRYLRLFPC